MSTTFNIWDGAAWRTAIGLSIYDKPATTWRTAKNVSVWDQAAGVWRLGFTTASISSLTGDCVAYGNTTSGQFDVTWTTSGDLTGFSVTLDWKIAANSASGTYSTNWVTGQSATSGTTYSGDASVLSGWAGDMNTAGSKVFIRARLVYGSIDADAPGSPKAKTSLWLS